MTFRVEALVKGTGGARVGVDARGGAAGDRSHSGGVHRENGQGRGVVRGESCDALLGRTGIGVSAAAYFVEICSTKPRPKAPQTDMSDEILDFGPTKNVEICSANSCPNREPVQVDLARGGIIFETQC